MIGKTVYKAKFNIVNEKIKVGSCKIINLGRTICTFDKAIHGRTQCHKSDIGVIYFFTRQEAIDYAIKELNHSIECGKDYLAKTKRTLKKALKLQKK